MHLRNGLRGILTIVGKKSQKPVWYCLLRVEQAMQKQVLLAAILPGIVHLRMMSLNKAT